MSENRPNLIFIMCDQLRYDCLGYAGHPLVQTPNLDHLAAQPRGDLAIGLKGADDRMKSKVFGNLSEEDATSLKEEMKFSGPIRMSDVEEVQLRTVKLVRKLEEAGKVKIARGDSTDKFV